MTLNVDEEFIPLIFHKKTHQTLIYASFHVTLLFQVKDRKFILRKKPLEMLLFSSSSEEVTNKTPFLISI